MIAHDVSPPMTPLVVVVAILDSHVTVALAPSGVGAIPNVRPLVDCGASGRALRGIGPIFNAGSPVDCRTCGRSLRGSGPIPGGRTSACAGPPPVKKVG